MLLLLLLLLLLLAERRFGTQLVLTAADGGRLAPAAALTQLGYGDEVRRYNAEGCAADTVVWQDRLGATHVTSPPRAAASSDGSAGGGKGGVFMPAAALAILEADKGFGKDRAA